MKRPSRADLAIAGLSPYLGTESGGNGAFVDITGADGRSGVYRKRAVARQGPRAHTDRETD